MADEDVSARPATESNPDGVSATSANAGADFIQESPPMTAVLAARIASLRPMPNAAGTSLVDDAKTPEELPELKRTAAIVRAFILNEMLRLKTLSIIFQSVGDGGDSFKK